VVRKGIKVGKIEQAREDMGSLQSSALVLGLSYRELIYHEFTDLLSTAAGRCVARVMTSTGLRGSSGALGRENRLPAGDSWSQKAPSGQRRVPKKRSKHRVCNGFRDTWASLQKSRAASQLLLFTALRVFGEEDDMVIKMARRCVCIVAILLPVLSARGQDQAVRLAELPFGAEPERIQNLLVLMAGPTAQDRTRSAQTDDTREQAELKPQTAVGREQAQCREEVRKIYEQDTPYPPRVTVWLKDGRKLHGSIAGTSSDTFLLRQKKNKAVTISYAEVVKGPVLPPVARGSEVGEGVAMFLGVGMIVAANVWFYNATHR
jgi:hypothetical protein